MGLMTFLHLIEFGETQLVKETTPSTLEGIEMIATLQQVFRMMKNADLEILKKTSLISQEGQSTLEKLLEIPAIQSPLRLEETMT